MVQLSIIYLKHHEAINIYYDIILPPKTPPAVTLPAIIPKAGLDVIAVTATPTMTPTTIPEVVFTAKSAAYSFQFFCHFQLLIRLEIIYSF